MSVSNVFGALVMLLDLLLAKGWASEGQPTQAQQQNCSPYSVNPALAYQLEGTINRISTSFVLDRGSAVTLLRHDHWHQVGTGELEPWAGANLLSANGSPIVVHGTVNVVLRFANAQHLTTTEESQCRQQDGTIYHPSTAVSFPVADVEMP